MIDVTGYLLVVIVVLFLIMVYRIIACVLRARKPASELRQGQIKSFRERGVL